MVTEVCIILSSEIQAGRACRPSLLRASADIGKGFPEVCVGRRQVRLAQKLETDRWLSVAALGTAKDRRPLLKGKRIPSRRTGRARKEEDAVPHQDLAWSEHSLSFSVSLVE